MLDLPSIREACQNLTATFLEPAAGEGVFLVEILKRKLKTVVERYGDDLTKFENYSLLALSTLYGIELLEDNAQKCVINMYQVYYDAYRERTIELNGKIKNKVLDSAKLIISKNIAQGNFLTKLSYDKNPIVLSEWKPLNLRKNTKTIKVQRTEYTLEEIILGMKKENGELIISKKNPEQLDLFELYEIEDFSNSKQKYLKYIPVNITEVYKEEMEEVYE